MAKPSALLAPAFCLVMVSAAAALSPPPARPQTILQFIEALDQAQPFDRTRLEQLTGRTLTCTEGERPVCEAKDVAFSDGPIGKLHFRSAPEGSILVLSEFPGRCLPIGPLIDRFGPGDLFQGCAHHICWYLTSRRSWGKLSFGLGNTPTTPCASSVVMDTYR